jgi:hypothetical protein
MPELHRCNGREATARLSNPRFRILRREKVTNLSQRSHQIGTFCRFIWRMKKFVSFRATAFALIAGFIIQVTCADASVSFLE